MKKFALILSVLIAGLGLSSCDPRPNVLGEWQGTIKHNHAGLIQDMTVTFGFDRAGGVNATYLFSNTMPLPQSDGIVEPYQMTISGTVTASGTWQYVENEDDEIALAIDPSTLDVAIDPEGVIFQTNVLTDQQEPQLDSLKTSIIESAKSQVLSSIKANGLNLYLDDVKVQRPFLIFELNDVKYTFHNVGQEK